MAVHVPVSEYRANMRAFHDRVRAGEEVIVTEHGMPSVRITSADVAGLLDRWEREGLLRRGRTPRPPSSSWQPIPTGPGDSTETISRDRDR